MHISEISEFDVSAITNLLEKSNGEYNTQVVCLNSVQEKQNYCNPGEYSSLFLFYIVLILEVSDASAQNEWQQQMRVYWIYYVNYYKALESKTFSERTFTISNFHHMEIIENMRIWWYCFFISYCTAPRRIVFKFLCLIETAPFSSRVKYATALPLMLV